LLSDDGSVDRDRPGARGDHIEESVWGVPAPALRPFIAGYAGYRQSGVAPARHRGLPSPYLTVIFTLDDPLTIAEHPDPRQPGGTYRTLVGGLHTSPALITHPGRQSGIQLALRPQGARALLGLPAGELVGIDLEGADVIGSLADQVGERIRAAEDWPGRFAVLDQILMARLADPPTGPAVSPELRTEVSYLWDRLVASGGRSSVSGLVAETGWSDRHLRGKFRAETGLTPKGAARVIRFDRARRLLGARVKSGATASLADLAAECGYYDQAHLAREFRDLAGCPPSVWLAEEFRNIQARPEAALESLPP
jgi:AraC-like DNA-binding protein